MAPGKAILLVDNDRQTHDEVAAMLDEEPYSLDSAYSGEEGLSRLAGGHYDLVLTAMRMNGMDGLTLLNRIQQIQPETPVVVLTSDSTPEAVVSAIRHHAYCLLGKPLARGSLLETVNSALNLPAESDDIEVISARPDWISIQLRCKLVIADRLAHFFRELTTELSPHERDSISSAFRELLMNAIEHGGRSDPNQKVNLTYVRTKRAIVYYLRDPGSGFSFADLAHAAVSNSKEQPLGHTEIRNKMGIRPGGFGILLTQNFADELLYSEKGNEVMLIKYIPQ